MEPEDPKIEAEKIIEKVEAHLRNFEEYSKEIDKKRVISKKNGQYVVPTTKHELTGERFRILFDQWKICTYDCKTSIEEYALKPEQFIVYNKRKINNYPGNANSLASFINVRLKRFYSENHNAIDSKIRISIESCQSKGTGAYRFNASFIDQDPTDSISILKKLEDEWSDYQTQLSLQKSYYPLQSGPKVLKVTYKGDEGCFFRPAGPLFVDFANGFVFQNKIKRDKIINKLKSRKPVLLSSREPAAGKSVLARSILFKKMTESLPVHTQYFQVSPQYQYINASEYKLVIDAISEFNSKVEQGLLIIEDAHLNPDLVNHILGYKDDFQNVDILIVSRRIDETLIFGQKNFESIKCEPVEPDDELIDGIIDRYLVKKLQRLQNQSDCVKAAIKKNAKNARTAINDVVKDAINKVYHNKLWKDKVNLWLLSYAFRAIEEKGLDIDEQDILSYVEKDIKKTGLFFAREGKRPLAERLILILSILFRFEFPTDKYFLREWFIENGYNPDDVWNVLDKLYEIGAITKNGHLYGLHHSALAELYYIIGQTENLFWKGDRIYHDEIEFLSSYITSLTASNGLQVYSKISRSTHTLTSTRKIILPITRSILKQQEKIIHKLNNSLELEEIYYFLIMLHHYDGDFVEELIEQIDTPSIIKAISLSNSLYLIGSILHLFLKSTKLKKILLELNNNKQILSEKFDKAKDPEQVARFIESVNKISTEESVKFCQLIQTEKYARKLNSYLEEGNCILNTDTNLCRCLKTIYKTSPLKAKKIWEKLNQELLFGRVKREKDIEHIGLQISYMCEDFPDFHEEIWHDIKNYFLRKFYTSEEIFLSIAAMTMIMEISSIMEELVWSSINEMELAKKLMGSDSFIEIISSVEGLIDVSNKKGYDFWRIAINKQELADKIIREDCDLENFRSPVNSGDQSNEISFFNRDIRKMIEEAYSKFQN